MGESKEKVSFIAFAPETGTMIAIDGHGGIKFTAWVPEDQFLEAIKAAGYVNRTFRLVLLPEDVPLDEIERL